MTTVLITGGTGLIGKSLTKMLLQKDYKVIVLTRQVGISDRPAGEGPYFAQWDIEKQTIDKSAIQQADYIIHLAGAGVAEKRWTENRKKEILESRTKSSELIVKTLTETDNKVKAVVSASAIGWYGADPAIPNPKPFVETDPADNSFLGETCKLWEQSIDPLTSLSKRLIKLRIGIVMSNEGGALKEFIKPLRAGVATILGDGKQVVSWVHLDDLCRLFIASIENESMIGVFNAVAPQPVDNKALVLELAKQMRGRFFVPVYVPSFVLKLMMGEMSIEVLKSATVSAEKIHKTGFQFLYPSIESALKAALKK
jgi:uncharacterized protein